MQARVVVDEADDPLAGRLAELAEQAAPRAAGADDQRPARLSRSRSVERARKSARSPNREAPITAMQSSASSTKTLTGKSPSGVVADDDPDRDQLGDADADHDRRPPRASRRSARSPGRGRAG